MYGVTMKFIGLVVLLVGYTPPATQKTCPKHVEFYSKN